MQKAQEDGRGERSQATQNKKCKEHSLDSTYVVDSRTHGNTVRRRRKCRICDKKIYTEEKIVAEGETPWSVKKVRRVEKTKPKRTRKRVLKPRFQEREKFKYDSKSLDHLTDEELEMAIMSGDVRFDDDEL